MNKEKIETIQKLLRRYSIMSTTTAGSGHPTSCLSATDLMAVLFFGGHFQADLDNPEYHNNDRLIFSKGHAAPLLYALYAVAGKVTEDELMKLRDFDSPLEGHPTMRFPFTEVATGSLGQGLSVGVGMAINAKYLDALPYTTYVLLGDSEMAEGSNWEALELASHYRLDNLVAILDVNRLGQRGETMFGHDVKAYKQRVEAFGWKTVVIDGHNVKDIDKAFAKAKSADSPVMIIAKTKKGQGVTFLADVEGRHGTALSKEEAEKALQEIGEATLTDVPHIPLPVRLDPKKNTMPDTIPAISYTKGDSVSTRKAYGHALQELMQMRHEVVVLDAETSNSTYAEMAKDVAPDRFFEMYIAEQNMAGTALGLARRGKKVFTSTFSAFWTRAHDQIRMAQYSAGNVVYVGSHGGISIGADGASQMALEDIALFRSLHESVVLYPCDAVSTRAATRLLSECDMLSFLRTTRSDTPVIYEADTEFAIGKARVVKHSDDDAVTVVTAGITLHEAIKAYEILQKENIHIRVIDLFSIKPLDIETVQKAADETNAIITVEDHYPAGGIGEAVATAVSTHEVAVHSLAVRVMPRSGTTQELLAYAKIDAEAIVEKVKQLVVL